MSGDGSSPEEFQDPLENFEPPKYGDPLEAALMEQSIEELQSRPFTTVAPETPIGEAVQTLAELDIACLMVAEGSRLVGLFTERDVLDKVADRFEELKDRPVRDVMTAKPVVVYETDSPAAALCVMAANGYRHVPVLDVKENILGVVSPQRVTSFLQKQFAAT